MKRKEHSVGGSAWCTKAMSGRGGKGEGYTEFYICFVFTLLRTSFFKLIFLPCDFCIRYIIPYRSYIFLIVFVLSLSCNFFFSLSLSIHLSNHSSIHPSKYCSTPFTFCFCLPFSFRLFYMTRVFSPHPRSTFS